MTTSLLSNLATTLVLNLTSSPSSNLLSTLVLGSVSNLALTFFLFLSALILVSKLALALFLFFASLLLVSFLLFFSLFIYFFTSCFLFSGSGILIPTAATTLLQVKYRSQDAEVFIPWLLCIDSLPVCRPQRMWGQPTGSQRPVRIHCRTRFTRTEVALSHIEDNMVSCVQSCSVLDADFLNVHIKIFSF